MPSRRYLSEHGLNMMSGYILLLQQDGLAKAREMADALGKSFHIYAIARRPRITVDPESVEISREAIRGRYSVQVENTFGSFDFSFQNSLGESNLESLTFTSSYPYTTYEIEADGSRVSWGKFAQALALFDPRNTRHLDLEILYVGQAYGSDGGRRATDRLDSHSTLQAIYAEAVGRAPDQEIWLLLFEFNPILLTSFDGTVGSYDTSEDEDSAHTHRILNEPVSDQQIINFTEAALIRYFEPKYNKVFKRTFPSPAHSTYSECYDLDLNQVSIEMNTEALNLRLWSKCVERKWLHIASFPLHSPEKRMGMFSFS